ncbi:T9SS type A sorting domain-containing protein [Microvirga sp. STS02]|uniref:T9SS type A sorting domain-containing protein n=1 Tax=Hymenobacter negativus TaxID=2795026 RepID=UPI0018DB9FCD|nr:MULTISPECIES: T9SS type A sorting domain-containing protein [Bacteria]MBH8569284.1 T9SS type A sorting domain-containing protein [Hymenobacter negativus]MBR7209019.1 T9SS type A sorting domain-containing protein [Microvirga sp. STS02]
MLLVAAGFGQHLAAQSLDLGFTPPAIYAPGTVYSALEQPDGKRVVVGAFSRVNGAPANYLTRLSPNGTVDAAFQQNLGTTSQVYRVSRQSNGQLLLVSYSTTVTAGGVTRNGLMRLNADGTGDFTFNPGSGPELTGSAGAVDQALPLPTGQTLVVGYFDHFNGATSNYITRLNASGTVDATFNNAGTGANDEIFTVVPLPSGKFMIGGYFTSYNGVPCNSLARLNADGSLDPTFVSPLAQYDQVINIAVQPDGRILVAGILSLPYGKTGPVRLLADGTIDNTFTPQATFATTGTVYSFFGDAVVVQPDGKILLTGSAFGSAGIIRLNSDGSTDASFQPGTAPEVKPLSLTLLASGGVLAAGSFTNFNGALDKPLVQLTSTGALDTSFQALIQLPGNVIAIVRQADGKLLVGGNFSEINGQTVRKLTRFNTNGSLDATFALSAPILTSVVRLALQPDGRLLVATPNSVQRYLTTGTLDNSFNAATVANSRPISQMLLQPDGRVLVGSNSGNSFSGNLWRLQADGSADASFAPTLSAGQFLYMQSMVLQPNGKVLLAGHYIPNSGTAYRTVIRLNSTGQQDAGFAQTPITTLSPTFGANELAVQADGKIVVGGQFTAVGGVSRSSIARLNDDGTHDTGFIPPALGGTVYKVVVQPNNRILVGGSFNGGGQPANLARLLSTGAADATYAATAAPNNSVRALLVQPDGTLMVGGFFTAISGQSAMALARLTASNVLHVQAPQAVAARTQAWPVPAHTALTVAPDASAHPQALDLLDALGRAVRHLELNGAAPASLALDNLPAGTYLLRVTYAEGAVTRRVQVQ